ncbi:MAG: GFA family protein [Pseudolabrys sp.]|nr:GFA family protein [Pseudolabrys sp.]
MKQNYAGGCQCGKVRYEVALDLDQPVISCNCSRCGRLGSLLSFAPAEEFKLISGEGDMTEYQFNKHAIHHLFCATCGIQSFARGTNPKTGAEMAAVNVRCVDGVDVDALKVQKVNGKDF